MNFSALMQLKGEWDSFKMRHPKFVSFAKAVCGQALFEGTVVDIKVTTPEGKVINSNIKLKKEDLELFNQFKDIC